MDSEVPQYNEIADLYDLAWGIPHGSADTFAYKTMADNTGGPILEMGAGTGRVAIELAASERSEHQIVALDLSPRMVEIAECKACNDLTAAQRSRLEFIVADMCNFDWEQPFALVILPFSALWECRSKDRVQAALSNAFRLLATPGTLFFDCSYYGAGGRQKRNAQIHSERRCSNGQGNSVIFREADWYDEAAGITEKWLYTDLEDERRLVVDRRTNHIQRVYLTPDETREALVRAGFRSDDCELFGSFDCQTQLDDPSFVVPNHPNYQKARQVWRCIKSKGAI